MRPRGSLTRKSERTSREQHHTHNAGPYTSEELKEETSGSKYSTPSCSAKVSVLLEQVRWRKGCKDINVDFICL